MPQAMINIAKVTNPNLAFKLHEILSAAFDPFAPLYTKAALETTIAEELVIKDRIESQQYTVYAATWAGTLAGTVSTIQTEGQGLYFLSMAVLPEYTSRGIARALMDAVEVEARLLGCNFIHLETWDPLVQAIRLYEKCGYRKTGRTRDYYGIEIFEMRKWVLQEN